MKRKLIPALLLVLTLTLLCAGAALADSGSFGDGFSWTLEEVSETNDELVLTVSGSGPMPEMSETYEGFPWMRWPEEVDHVVISEGVTTVAAEAFKGMPNLKTVTLPEGITSIGSGAFYYAENLASVNLPEGLETICDRAFFVTAIPTVSLPESVESVGTNAFACNSALEKVTIPASVTTFGDWVFSGCDKLTSAGPIGSGCAIEFGWTDAIPDRAFDECASITKVIIPDTVTEIGEAAFYNNSFTTVTLPAGLTTLGDEVFSNSRIQKITIPSGVKVIPKEAFIGADLKSITLPEGLETIGEVAFWNCDSLTSITIPSTVTSIGYSAFGDCESLTKFTLLAPVENLSRCVLDCSGITEFTFPEGSTTIPESAFFCCESLTTVNLPSTLETIEEEAFYGCDALTRVNFAGTDAEWNTEWTASFPEGVEIYCEYLDKGSCDICLEWSMTKEGLLTIWGDGVMQDLEAKEYPWYKYRNLIKEISVEKIPNISAKAFQNAKNLETVRFEASILIDSTAFKGTDVKAVYFNGLRSEWKNGNVFPYDRVHYYTGMRDGVLYKDGTPFTGLANKLMYEDGLPYTGMVDETVYIEGKAQTKKGWVKDPSTGKWYYYKNSKMVYGWLTLGTTRYCFDKEGAMYTGFVKISGDGKNGIRFFKSSGAMVTEDGWKKIEGKWYYFEGTVVKTGKVEIGTKTYFLDENGVMIAEDWVKIDKKWYYFDRYGVMKTGWLKLSGKWYYLDPETGAMVTNAVVDGWKLNKYGVGSKIK